MVAKHGPDDFAEMLKRYDRAMNRLVNGDPEPIKALYSHSDETSQCGAWGGVERGWAEVNARWDWVTAQFIPAESTLKQRNRADDVTAIDGLRVLNERGHVRLVDRPTTHYPLDLRVTAVFRREADGWKAVHRHGDYLVTLKQRIAVSVVPHPAERDHAH